MLPIIGPDKALGKFNEYLTEVDRLKNLGHLDGESQREQLNYKIKAFIKNAFDKPNEKIKEYNNYVNFFFAVLGKRKTSKEKESEYQYDMAKMKTMLLSYKEELEMVSHNEVAPETTSSDSKNIFIVHGRDTLGMNELARIIDKEFNLCCMRCRIKAQLL